VVSVGVPVGANCFHAWMSPADGCGTVIRALARFEGSDLPVILGVTLVAAAAIILLDLVVDIVLLAIDPTVSRRGRGVQRLLGRAA